MGIGASQARLLTLTSRLRDIEYRQESLSNIKMRFANESDAVSAKYTKALNKQKLQYKDYNTGEYHDLTLSQMYHNVVQGQDGNIYGCQYRLYKKDGTPVQEGSTIYNNFNNDPGWLYEAIESGEFYLVATDNSGNASGGQVNIASDTSLSEVRDDSDEAIAKAEYDAAMRKINNKEKQIDSQISRLNTEYSAANQEYDSVKQIISDNTQYSFKLFG
ncbi:hypothetical protein IKE67_03470 [bacterium]|nr:hypothetical protein [bacterium]